jgi:hypothetical protein
MLEGLQSETRYTGDHALLVQDNSKDNNLHPISVLDALST